jgi:acetyl-CoA carboxylase biotin carboxyl carrier protein
MPGLDRETIRHALEVARREGFQEVELEAASDRFTGRLAPSKGFRPSSGASAADRDAETGPQEPAPKPITATCVGFYRPSDSKLIVGSKVERGEIVATIAALGLANDVESPVSGEIVEVLVAPDQAVEYGQALALVKEA